MNRSNAEFGIRNAEWKAEKSRCRGAIPHSPLCTPHSSGFTLIEVLLAMTILAIILAGVYASFATAGRNIEAAESSRDETDLARTLIARLSDDIANAYYTSTSLGAPRIFYGKREDVEAGGDKITHDSISLTTLTNWRRPDTKETDLWEVGYFFKEKPDGTGDVFMRREKRELSKDAPALQGGDEYEITDQVLSLRFRYYDGSKWLDAWDSRTLYRLPTAVEIALTLGNGKVYVTQVDTGR